MNKLMKHTKIIGCIICMISAVPAFTAYGQQSVNDKDAGIRQVAIKNNLLYDAAMIPNIGVEVALQDNWSLCGNWLYAWWQNDSRHRFWHFYGGEIEVRKWLGKRARTHVLQGHHLGSYFMGGTYDFEWGHDGYMSDFSYNVGISYGYAVKIARHLTLDFVIGIGYVGGYYRKYKPENGGYCILEYGDRSYFGPTKAEISLVWAIGDLFKGKKGGRK